MSNTALRTGFIAAIGLSAFMLLNRGAFAGGKEGQNLKKDREVATAKGEFGKSAIPKSVGSFMGYDYTERDINDPGDKLFLDDAPGAASTNRIAVVLRGGSQHILGGAAFGAKQFAERVHDASFLHVPDEDGEPSTATLSIYAHGSEFVIPISISGATDPETHNPVKMELDDTMSEKDIAVKTYKAMQGAYNKHLAPRILREETDPKPQND